MIVSSNMLLADWQKCRSVEQHDKSEKQRLLEVVRPSYLKSSKVEKQKILEEFSYATRYHWKCCPSGAFGVVYILFHGQGCTQSNYF